MRPWVLLTAAVLPIACGGGPDPGPPANRDTISLEDPAPPDMDAGGEVELDEGDTIAPEGDAIADAETDTGAAVADTGDLADRGRRTQGPGWGHASS